MPFMRREGVEQMKVSKWEVEESRRVDIDDDDDEDGDDDEVEEEEEESVPFAALFNGIAEDDEDEMKMMKNLTQLWEKMQNVSCGSSLCKRDDVERDLRI